MSATETETQPTTALVSKGRGTAVHAGVWDTTRGWVTLCNGWGAVDARSSAVRVNRYAEAVTCKTCLKHQAAADADAAKAAESIAVALTELEAAAEAHQHITGNSGVCHVCFELVLTADDPKDPELTELERREAALPAPVAIGGRVSNGSTVLQAKPEIGGPWAVFLCITPDAEFVTWVGMSDGTRTTAGHYFQDDLAGALADFLRR